MKHARKALVQAFGRVVPLVCLKQDHLAQSQLIYKSHIIVRQTLNEIAYY